eukprot:CAMPEP_0182420784 /NCGR_PEP_ID=MMETSP1167-20130531/5858_1 /TAXON_ID=2988 /ORGANISM="Mallomonas Sp, Strain CCMP3275" /LENGTH=233 /DNA_ID=CAMNT_0024597229 /DNA_START=46 /DNA_END=744 /DNA_ORIENTATION=+
MGIFISVDDIDKTSSKDVENESSGLIQLDNDPSYQLEDVYEIRMKAMTIHEAQTLLKCSIELSQRLIRAYHAYQYPPVVTFEELKSLFALSVTEQNSDICVACLKIFGRNGSCYIQEVILALILLNNHDWEERLSVIYDLFVCIGTEEMYREDIQLLLYSAGSAMGKVWGVDPPHIQLTALSEHLADLAAVKLEKDLEEGISKEEFIQWAISRFKSSKIVANTEYLMKIYGSQ